MLSPNEDSPPFLKIPPSWPYLVLLPFQKFQIPVPSNHHIAGRDPTWTLWGREENKYLVSNYFSKFAYIFSYFKYKWSFFFLDFFFLNCYFIVSLYFSKYFMLLKVFLTISLSSHFFLALIFVLMIFPYSTLFFSGMFSLVFVPDFYLNLAPKSQSLLIISFLWGLYWRESLQNDLYVFQKFWGSNEPGITLY